LKLSLQQTKLSATVAAAAYFYLKREGLEHIFVFETVKISYSWSEERMLPHFFVSRERRAPGVNFTKILQAAFCAKILLPKNYKDKL
jgi:hypothetical protein